MRSCSYDRVFLIPSRPGNDNRRPGQKSGLSKISIAWWLVPCVVVWAASALVFG